MAKYSRIKLTDDFLIITLDPSMTPSAMTSDVFSFKRRDIELTTLGVLIALIDSIPARHILHPLELTLEYESGITLSSSTLQIGMGGKNATEMSDKYPESVYRLAVICAAFEALEAGTTTLQIQEHSKMKAHHYLDIATRIHRCVTRSEVPENVQSYEMKVKVCS